MMCKRLLDDNDILLQDLNYALTEAENIKEMGLANYLQDRIDIHKKHRWMLKSIVKA